MHPAAEARVGADGARGPHPAVLRLSVGLALLALALAAVAALRGVAVPWPLWAFAVLAAGNGAALLGVGRTRPRLVRAYWLLSCAAALAGIAAVIARTARS
jgi:hypothetical protein